MTGFVYKTPTAMRTKHKRTKDGCITCRIRRIKCSQEKPACRKCTSTGRKCDGYSTAPGAQPAAYLVVMTVPFPDERRECASAATHAFHFFRRVCAPQLVNFGSESFWNGMVLQACHAVASIKHLVCAASYLNFLKSSIGPVDPPCDQAFYMIHYGKALRLLSDASQPDITIILMACLLLVICEESNHNRWAALQHIRAGKNIIQSYLREKRRMTGGVKELIEIFARIILQTGEFDQETRISYTRLPLGRPDPDLIWMKVGGDYPEPIQGSLPATKAFKTLDQAARSLVALSPSCFLRGAQQDPPMTSFHTVPATAELNSWASAFNAYVANLPTTLQPWLASAVHILEVHRQCLHILSRTHAFYDESLFDKFVGIFEHILAKCTRLDLDLTCGLEPPLFLAATRCRDASLRRTAIAVLRSCGREGRLLAKIAMLVMGIEEDDIAEPTACDDIPAVTRIRLVDLETGYENRLRLRYLRHPYLEEACLSSVEVNDQNIAVRGWSVSAANALLAQTMNFSQALAIKALESIRDQD